MKEPNRRDILEGLVALSCLGLLPTCRVPPVEPEQSFLGHLPKERRRALRAAVDRLLPGAVAATPFHGLPLLDIAHSLTRYARARNEPQGSPGPVVNRSQTSHRQETGFGTHRKRNAVDRRYAGEDRTAAPRQSAERITAPPRRRSPR